MGGSMAWGNVGLIAAKSFGIWLGISLVGLLLAHRIAGLLKTVKQSAAMAITALGMALLLAGFFEQVGLAMIVGAFVMGASLSKTDISFKIRSALSPIYALLVPVFFVVMGMLVDIRVLASPTVLKMGIIYSVLAIAAKVCGCAIPALFLNFNWVGALRIGFGMVPRSEVALIVASIGATTMMRDASGKMVPIFDGGLFGVAIIMTLITVLVAPPLLSAVLSIKRSGVKKERPIQGSVTSKFVFHSEVVATFMMRGIIEDFDQEGFLNSGFRKDIGFIQFRRREQIVSLRIQEDTFAFESSPDLVPLVKTIVYESLVEIRHSVLKLQELARPDDLQEEIFGNDRTILSETPSIISQGIDMAKLLSPDCIIVCLQAQDKEGACRELLSAINRSRPLLDMEQCFNDVMERENIISTYQGDGIALPHGRTDGSKELRTAIGIKQENLDFDPGENHLVQIIVLSVCPKETSEPYLQYIVNIAGVLSKADNRQAILAASTPAQVRKVFLNPQKA